MKFYAVIIFNLEIFDALSLPFLIRLDTFALTRSLTRDKPLLLHPSVPTCFNITQKITNVEKLEKLRVECNNPSLFTKVLEKHQTVRLFEKNDSLEITSGLHIIKVISLWAHIIKL